MGCKGSRVQISASRPILGDFMGLIESAQAHLLLALLTAVTGPITLGILWKARGRAVYLYASSTVLAALYFLAFADLFTADPFGSAGGKGLLAFGAIGAAWLKNMSIGLLATPTDPTSRYFKGTVLVGLGVALSPILLTDKVAFATVLNLAVIMILGRACQIAYRVGVEIDSGAAKFFTVLVGAQLVFIFAGVVMALLTESGAFFELQPQPAWSLGLTMSLALINTSLFIALVFDINIRERESAQRNVTALEVSRSRAHEREMLLADMHDGLGSQISTARMRVERGQMNQAEVAELLRECMADIHLMVDTLREQNDDLESALVDYRARVERRIAEQGIGLSWAVDLERAPPMAPRRMLQVLRVIQESITNAIRHAKAKEIIVTVRHTSDAGYVIRIEDDGVGIADEASPGRGLANMRRRARELGGTLEIRRRRTVPGTEVVLSFVDRPV